MYRAILTTVDGSGLTVKINTSSTKNNTLFSSIVYTTHTDLHSFYKETIITHFIAPSFQDVL